MRIAHVIDYFATSDGHVAVCAALAAGQSRFGHACTVAAASVDAGSERLLPPEVPLRTVATGRRLPGSGAPWPRRRSLERLLDETRPELLHLHGLWSPIILASAAAAGKRGIPSVLSVHGLTGPFVAARRRRLKRCAWHLMAARCVRRVQALHAASEREADDLRAWGFRQPVAVIPLGVDLPAWAADRPLPDPAAVRTALFLSRLHPSKGVPLLLGAWAAVRPAGWRLVVAGPGSDADRTAIRSAIDGLHLQAEVELAGEADAAGRDARYRAADLFVLPSHSENFGLVVAEAMAAALPVITTLGTPWGELPSRGCGWCVPVATDALARALREATSLSDADRRAMGMRGRQWVEACFSAEACNRRMLGLYADLLHADE